MERTFLSASSTHSCVEEPSRKNSLVVVLLAATIIGIDVYAATNPYVVKHLLSWNASSNPLRSNIENSKAMYLASLSIQSVKDATKLLSYAATPAVIGAGVLGVIGLLLSCRGKNESCHPERTLEGSSQSSDQPQEHGKILREYTLDDKSVSSRGALPLLIAPALIILAQFTLLAAGKPGEFARFAMFPAVVLLIFSAAFIGRLIAHQTQPIRFFGALIGAAVLINVLPAGSSYIWHFINDARTPSTRHKIAARSAELSPATLKISAEPAPYSVPPVDLFNTKLVLTDDLTTLASGEMSLRAIDVVSASKLRATQPPVDNAATHDFWMRPRLMWTPISWANKTFEVRSGGANSTLSDR